MKHLAILEETFIIRNRIKELASRADIEVIETTSPRQLLSLLNVPNNIGLIITELEFRQEDNFEVFAKIKKSAGLIPVMILTSDNSRANFLKAIRMGAADYILKPIDGDFLFKRMIDLISDESAGARIRSELSIGHGIPNVSVNFISYIKKEIKKAKKAKYPVSIMISLIIDPRSRLDALLDKRYQMISNALFDELSAVLFETDIFLKYSSRSFIGVFPFCGIENVALIDEKLQTIFNRYKETHQEKYITLISQFATNPDDGEDYEILLEKVEMHMRKSIQDLLTLESENEIDL